jgi:hypothetical protein
MEIDIAVGRVLLRIGEPAGAALHEASRAERAHIRTRPTPIQLRPRLIRGLVGRRMELAAAVAGLDAGIPVEVSGGPGIGKTAVLRQLAYDPRADTFEDGVVYLSARHESSVDLLQRLFEAFYESDTVCKPTDAEIQRALQDKHALILLDDVSLRQRELEAVLDMAPRCAFVVGTRERCLWGEVRGVVLAGLPVEHAVALLERELERGLDPSERSPAATVCAALDGHPLRIQQAAALIRERAIPAEAWPQHISNESFVAEVMTSIDEKQRRVLLALTALTGVPVAMEHISGIAELNDVEPTLMTLVRQNLVLGTQSRYHLADGISDRLRRTEDPKPWLNRAITYFTAWAERHRRRPESLVEASDALLLVQEHACDARRSGEVLRLGLLLEGPLVAGARWGAWGTAVERCLTAARALGDRTVEAWALHEIGTRAACLGHTDSARRFLMQSASLRDSLGERAAAAVSRRNLGFVAPRAADDVGARASAMVDDRRDLSSDLLRDDVGSASIGISNTTGVGAASVVFLLCAMLGGVTYAVLPPSWKAWHVSARDSVQQAPQRDRAADTAVTPPPPRAAAEPRAASATQPPIAERANILIFTARPGSIATTRRTELCYAVSGASQARIEPGIGDVDAAATLTCRRIAPARTTTYELSAVGRDGIPVTQQLVIVVR